MWGNTMGVTRCEDKEVDLQTEDKEVVRLIENGLVGGFESSV